MAIQYEWLFEMIRQRYECREEQFKIGFEKVLAWNIKTTDNILVGLLAHN